MRAKPGSVIISFRASAKEADWMEHYARAEHRTRASWLRKLVTDRLLELGTKKEAAS